MKTFFKIFNLLGAKNKFFFILFLLLNWIKLLADIVSLGLIPVIASSLFNNKNLNFVFFNYIKDQIDKLNFFNLDDLFFYFSLIISLIILKNFFNIILAYFQNQFVYNLNQDFYKKIYKNTTNQNYNFFLENRLSSIVRDIDCAKFFGKSIKIYLNIIIECIFIFIIIFLIFLNLRQHSNIDIFSLYSLVIFAILFYYTKIKNIAKRLSQDRFILSRDYLESINISFLNFKKNIIDQSFKTYYINFKNRVKEFCNIDARSSFFSDINRPAIEIIFVLVLGISAYAMKQVNLNEKQIFINLTFLVAALIRILPSVNSLVSNLNYLNQKSAEIKFFIAQNKKIFLNKKYKIIKIKNFLKLENIFFKIKERYILKNISIFLKKNDIVGIVGKSGAGKTTLIDIICGLLKPSGGNIYIDIDNINYSQINYILNAGYLDQIPVSLNHLNYQYLNKKNKKIKNTLKNFKLDHKNLFLKKDQFNLNLSGGEKQRLNIFQIYRKNKNLEIYDEPFNMLDDQSKEKFLKDLKRRKKNKIIIIVTHDKKVLNFCNTVIKVNKKTAVQVR